METQILRELGFSEREAKVYVALLALGQSTVGPIAAKTRMQHSKVYQTLEKLIDRGLVSFVIQSKAKCFSAQEPKQILNALKEKELRFGEILPRLNALKELSKEKQVATVYEGPKAIASMFRILLADLKKNSWYYIFALKEDYAREDCRRFLRNLHMRISQKKSDNRIILHDSVRHYFKENSGDIPNISCKFTKHSFPPGLMIINDKVINWRWGERPTAVEITSSAIAGQYKDFFLEVWKKI